MSQPNRKVVSVHTTTNIALKERMWELEREVERPVTVNDIVVAMLEATNGMNLVEYLPSKE